MPEIPLPVLAAVLVGLVVAAVGLYLLLKARAAARWQTVPGRVRSARVTEQEDTDPDRVGIAMLYAPEITYDFVVGGRTYVGERVEHQTAWHSRRDVAEAVIARYPVGQEVTVFVDPADPARSVLEPKGGGRLGLALLVAGGLLAVGVGAAALRVSR